LSNGVIPDGIGRFHGQAINAQAVLMLQILTALAGTAFFTGMAPNIFPLWALLKFG